MRGLHTRGNQWRLWLFIWSELGLFFLVLKRLMRPSFMFCIDNLGIAACEDGQTFYYSYTTFIYEIYCSQIITFMVFQLWFTHSIFGFHINHSKQVLMLLDHFIYVFFTLRSLSKQNVFRVFIVVMSFVRRARIVWILATSKSSVI